MRTLLSGLTAAFAIFFFTATPAAAESINCPLSSAQRTIVNDLPDGWWTTPIENTLSGTRVQNIGGEPALMCEYGPAGSVQRNAPPNHTCTARTGGFECTPRIRLTPLPIPIPITPVVHSEGAISVGSSYTFDLDTGAVGGAGADIWYEAETATVAFLSPRGGAQIAVGDRSNRGFAGCSSATFSTTRVPLASLPVNSFVCVRTSEGRISQFRVRALSAPGAERTLRLNYTTWR